MAKPLKATENTAVAERTIESTGSQLRLLLRPLPDQKVEILEYHRCRKGESRYNRQKDEEGHILPFHLLKLDQTFEELFPQATLFEAAAD